MRMKDRLSKAYGQTASKEGETASSRNEGEAGGLKGPQSPLRAGAARQASPPRGDRPAQAASTTKASTTKPSQAKALNAKALNAKALNAKAANAKAAAAETASLDAAETRAEGLLKSGGETGISRAAKFLLLLGTDEAAKVLSQLPAEDIERVSKEILGIKNIDAIEANEVLAEFGWLVKTKGWALEGGPETAEKILIAAFGPERARELLRKAAPETIRPFRFLNDFEPAELMVILKDESSQVLALILPYIEPKRASGLIELLQEAQRIEVVKRVARLEKINPDVIRRVEDTLKDRIRRIGTVASDEIDGKAALAGILRHVDPRLEARVLDALDEESPEISRSVRERLFTLDDVVRVPSRELQKALRDFQDRDLALVLKGRSDEFREKILANVSRNRRELIIDEYKILGAVRREDADEAARELLAYLKHAWDAGELILEGEDELVE